MHSIRTYLLGLVILLIALATLAFAMIARDVQLTARAQSEAQVQETASMLSLAVDGELKGKIGLIEALAGSRAVRERDWDAVDRQARAALSDPEAWIVVHDRSGRQLVNTRLARGSPLPSGPAPTQMWREFNRTTTRICDLVEGQLEAKITCIDRLVDGGDYAISVILQPRFFQSIVNRQQVADGHVAALVDRTGKLIWRNIRPEQFVGVSATPDMRSAIASAESGVRESVNLDGLPSLSAFRKSALSGWTVIVGTPLPDRAGAFGDVRWSGSFAALGLLALGSILALFLARRVSTAVRQVGRQLGDGGSQPSTGFVELDQLQSALQLASAARRESEERYRRIFEQASDLIITADLQQVITDCNPSAAAAVGLSRADAVGRKISEFISPEDFERTTAALRQKMEGGGTTRYDVRVRSSTGEWLFWEINSGLTHDEEGRPIGLHVVGRDVTERKRWENHQRLLVGELNHRVKNTLAIVQSLSHQTFRAEASSHHSIGAFEGRLQALAAAHNLLTRENWESASLREIVEEALAPFCSSERCSLTGDDFRLVPQTAVTLALALHELATNASKYGALSNGAGRVDVRWGTADGMLDLEWREQDGPRVVPPITSGFGTKMIRRALAAELKATVQVEFEPEGVRCTVRAPMKGIAAS